MIGRGTRLCPDLFGPGQHKEYFNIFDWCRNFEFFNENPEVTDGASPESLAKRLFAARVAVVAEIDGKRPAQSPTGECSQAPTPVLHATEPGSDADRAEALDEIRQRLVSDLRTEIAGMNLDNFLVRPKRLLVEKYAAVEAWSQLNADAQHELIEQVAGLPSAAVDDDLVAKQFDLVVFRTELALLRVDPAFRSLKERIMEIASLLEALPSVPMVAAEMTLILEIQTDDFWQGITLPMLETVRRRLRALVKLIEFKKRPIVYSDFEDRAGASAVMAVQGIPIGTNLDAFRRKARVFLQPYQNHIAILKLRRNEPLTKSDLAEIERIFVEAGVDQTSLDALRSDGGLGRFVRSLVGLDHAAAKQAFAGFIDGKALTANQLEFLDLVIDHLTARGVMDPKLLYESPFTDFDSNGVEGVFNSTDAATLIQTLRAVESNAA
jgi:type I restriction enzyme R subunit